MISFRALNIQILFVFLTISNFSLFLYLSSEYESSLSEIDNLKEIYHRKSTGSTNLKCEPTLIYEKKRKRIRSTLQYLWESVKHKILQIQNKSNKLKNEFTEILEDIYNHKISILSDWQQMSLNDGYENWRQKEFKQINQLIQKRFHDLMNPKDCSAVEVVIWPQWHICGWGCSAFHYVESFAYAFGHQKFFSFVRLLHESKRFGSDLFTKYYEPLSQKCNETIYHNYSKWTDLKDPRVVALPISFWLNATSRKYMYQAVPKDLLPRLEKIVDVPALWFVSQIETFLLKLNSKYAKYIEVVIEQIGFQHPIVGVHIRRTDKKREYKLKPLEEYMEHVKEFYDTLELTQKVDKRRVFVATDDLTIMEKLTKNYADKYEFIVNKNTASEANNVTKRYRNPVGVITDIELLAKCDFFVGTMSSNMGRRVVEFMQRTNFNVFEKFYSVQFKYFEYIGLPFKFKVLIAHKTLNFSASVEDTFLSLDLKQTAGKTTLIYKNRKVEIPSYKLEEVPRAVDFPINRNEI